LIASIIAAALWVLIKFVRACGRFFRALLNPSAQSPRAQTKIDVNPHLLKRAGQ
jgi:hypothetical protein